MIFNPPPFALVKDRRAIFSELSHLLVTVSVTVIFLKNKRPDNQAVLLWADEIRISLGTFSVAYFIECYLVTMLIYF